ncbi:PhzF family phenazine biosynthesis protein [Rubrivirga sp.]|uniref:PhzF family phenazine biosynthesis protein n=1 Tax=Rubrivirga sp. TaxID=1885344 RepID=UPI003C7107CA
MVAFSSHPAGGNPAGVWIGEEHPSAEGMQRIALEVGYSETAFVAPAKGAERAVRYFSPEVEVPFCGHATIATGVALGLEAGAGAYRLSTAAGTIPVDVREHDDEWRASLTSVEPSFAPVPAAVLEDALRALRWDASDLDAALPPALAYAGARHLVLAVSEARRLADLEYDFDALASVLRSADAVTAQLVWRERDDLFHSRNPFPVGGVVEDPATGAAAAALGGYLREAGLIEAPTAFTIRQGEAMGRPSTIHVAVPPSGGIVVMGTAVCIPDLS